MSVTFQRLESECRITHAEAVKVLELKFSTTFVQNKQLPTVSAEVMSAPEACMQYLPTSMECCRPYT